MKSAVVELCANLESQVSLYLKLEEIENRKNQAILEKKGRLLKEVTAEEEFTIKKIDFQENRRIEISAKISGASGTKALTLKDIASMTDPVNAGKIMALGMKLKAAVLSVKSMNEVNMKMMKDNMEFFKIMVDGIKGSAGKNEAYSSRGEHRIEQMKRPMIFNKTV